MTNETETIRATEVHLSYPVRDMGLYGPRPGENPAVRRVHAGTYAECGICIPRTTGRSLPNYRRTIGA
jgi:hypothetical protein